MTDVIEQDGGDVAPLVGGPGHHLREAREARKLTQAQVAMQLRLQTRIIEALERDDYHALPGSTFVQGYLRSYARLLGLAENHIVALAPLESVAPPSLVSSIAGGESEASSRDLPFRIMSFLLLVVVVIGVGWWLSQQEQMAARLSPPGGPSAGGEQGLVLPDETPAPAASEVDEALPVDAASEAGDEQGDVDEGQGDADEGQGMAVSPPAPMVIEPAQAVRASAPIEPPPLTAEMPQSLLELEYQADSWSEVSDAAGRKLVYGLIPAGQRLALHGEAPFRVFLGYANGVLVYYNGSLYDHTPFQSGDMARFRLGRVEHNRPAAR
jgi:cytoskeleton protein RodZ